MGGNWPDRRLGIIGAGLFLAALACASPVGIRPVPITPTPTGQSPAQPIATAPAPAGPTRTALPDTSSLIEPSELVYLGAFRLPADPDGMGWEYGGDALAYYPLGDPAGPDDGFPGSLFAAGHNWTQYVGELAIPVPVISAGRQVDELNTAVILQELADIRGDLYQHLDFEIPRAGLAYLPPQSGAKVGRLYFCWGQHMQEGSTAPSHGYCELDLVRPNPAGLWRIGDFWNYVTTDYLFEIPAEWAARYTPGMLLATGRFRDGGQGAQGPSLIAYRPPDAADPPPVGSQLDTIPLLLYGDVFTPDSPTLAGYHHADEWAGAAWLTAGDRAAVVFVGTKGQGNCWYGFADGTVWPDEPPYPEIPPPPNDERGWWSDSFVGQMLFYDPAELAAVAQGEMEPWQPQPYAVLEMDGWLWHVSGSQQKSHLSAASFDREHGLLYVLESLADEDRPLAHVWRVGEAAATGE